MEETEQILSLYDSCMLCPRQCKVNRSSGQKGVCGVGARPMIARAALHMWEEPCISGKSGSGAVFFSGCNLHCIFCQNQKISGGKAGREISEEQLAECYLSLQEQGANNINLVTGTQFLPSIVVSVHMARKKGLHIPVIYNCGGYESVEALKLLEGCIDVYLPDFKYLDEGLSKEYSHAKDYAVYAKPAIEEMVRQVGAPVFGEDGMIQKGVIVRHLVLPGEKAEAQRVIDYLYKKFGNQIYLSLMNQYTPMEAVKEHPKLKRRVTSYEYEKVIDYALEQGVTQAYRQCGRTSEESFIPEFY